MKYPNVLFLRSDEYSHIDTFLESHKNALNFNLNITSNKDDLNSYVAYIEQTIRELNMSLSRLNIKTEIVKVNECNEGEIIRITKEIIKVKEELLINISKKRGELIELLRKINQDLDN